MCQWSRRAGEAQNVSGDEREVAWADCWGCGVGVIKGEGWGRAGLVWDEYGVWMDGVSTVDDGGVCGL